jgi:hypothetical protein
VPPHGADIGKLCAAIASVREGTPTLCGTEASLPQTQVARAAPPEDVAESARTDRIEGFDRTKYSAGTTDSPVDVPVRKTLDSDGRAV